MLPVAPVRRFLAAALVLEGVAADEVGPVDLVMPEGVVCFGGRWFVCCVSFLVNYWS